MSAGRIGRLFFFLWKTYFFIGATIRIGVHPAAAAAAARGDSLGMQVLEPHCRTTEPGCVLVPHG